MTILFQGKAELNTENSYNQNFRGLYCTCQRPYPDPEAKVCANSTILCLVLQIICFMCLVHMVQYISLKEVML